MKKTSFVKKTIDFSKKFKIELVRNFAIFDSVSSTNNKARELVRNGEKDGTIIISRIQTEGRGRFDRIWESPDGGLYISLILQPDVLSDKITLLPLLASLAVYDSIDNYDVSIKIKWPNDVNINGKKISGILLESEANECKKEYLVLGIGINLNSKITDFSKELRGNVTSLSNELKTQVNFYEFLELLILSINKYYTLFLEGNFNTILEEWKKKSDTIGRKVKIRSHSEEIMGEVFDIDQSGFLLLLTESGRIKKITSGDCIYL